MRKVILITGASSGLGKAMCEEFAKAGNRVIGTSRNISGNNETIHIDECVSYEMINLDVTDEESCNKAVNYVVNNEGRIDLLVNNAGFGIAGSLELTDEEEMRSQIDTNFFGAFRMYRAVIPYMRKQQSGRIINVSSVASVVPIPFQSLYSAGKAALDSLSQSADMEVRRFGIKSVTVRFGDMKTGFTRNRVKTKGTIYDELSSRTYTERFEHSLKTMERDEQNGHSPQFGAKLIVKISDKKKPKPIYVCRFDYKLLVILRRLLPVRLTDYVISKIYS